MIGKVRESTIRGFDKYASISAGEVSWGSATGGTVSTSSGYTYHTFTASGTLTVTRRGKFEYLVIAGGGGGGSNTAAGGGAGGVLSGFIVLDEGAQTMRVGTGGGGGFGRNNFDGYTTAQGRNGNPSRINSDVIAVGGGGGGRTTTGGSGGGGNGLAIPGQGNDGAIRGGGGAGFPAVLSTGGDGTPDFSNWGLATSTGVDDGTGTRYYAGGGGGSNVSSRGLGGKGGGGRSGFETGENDHFPGDAGTPNSGGGGGSGWSGAENYRGAGLSGGSGIIIVRYAT